MSWLTQKALGAAFAMAIALGSLAGVGHAQVAENLPLDHWAYEAVYHLRNRGWFRDLFLGARPFNRMEIARTLDALYERRLLKETGLSRYEAFLLDRLRMEFAQEIAYLRKTSRGEYALLELHPRTIGSTVSTPTDKQRWIGLADLGIRLGQKAFVFQRFEADSDGLLDNDYRGTEEKYGLTGSVKAAYLAAELPWFRIIVGRDAFAWGPSLSPGLLISNNSPAFDMIGLSGRLWRLQFTAIISSISKLDDPELGRINRYLSAHRLSFKPTESLELGIAEAVVYGGPGRKFDLLFSNPFLFYFAADAEIKEENNILWSADASWHFGQNRLYGEFLVDDLSLDRKSPDKIGYRVGLEVAEPLSSCGWDVRLQYTRINTWTYNFGFDVPWNRFVNYRGIIGSPLGPDADALSLRNSLYVGAGVRMVTETRYLRRGEGRVDTPTPVPAGDNFGYRHERFPSGTVERTLSNSLTLEYQPSIYWYLAATVGHLHIWNVGHQVGVSSSQVQFKIVAGYRFRRHFFFRSE